MPPIHALQASFTGGEFAPSLYARVDLQKYATGTKTLRNFFAHPHGGASNRPGTRFVATAKYPTKAARLVSFEFSATQTYILEFGDLYCRFYTQGGQILASAPAAWSNVTTYAVGDMVTYAAVKYIAIQAGLNHQPDISPTFWTAQSIYEIATPYAEADLPNLKFNQSADTLYITHQSYVPRTLQRFANDSWTLAAFAANNGPFMLSNTTTKTITPSATTGAITLTASAATFNGNMVGGIYKLIHQVPGQSVLKAFGATGTSTSISCGTNWRILTHGTWTGTFRIEQSIDNGASWQELRTFEGTNDFNANTFGAITEFALIRLNCTAWTSGTISCVLTSDPFERVGIATITGFVSSTVVNATVTQTMGLTTATSDWAEGSWSVYRGFPACSAFYQDRLCFASTPSEPQTLWMTETGNYTSFNVSDPVVDSDAISINLPGRKINSIKSLVSLQQIIGMTAASEWSIGPSDNASISPTSVNAQIQDYHGCNQAEPIVIGNRVIFVQPMGSVVRDIGIDFTVSGFSGTNLSILSNHLFTNYSITEMAYQQEPEGIVWCVRSDGTLLSLTYLLEQQVIAWARHDTNGTYLSVASIPVTGYNEVWFLVQRGSNRYIERMVQRLASSDPRDQFFVDCGLSYDSPVVISGATQANPVVITATAHGFNNGDFVDVRGVVGMTQINDRRYIVANKTANTFEVKDIDTGVNVDGTAYTAYANAGQVRKATNVITGLSHLNGFSVNILADGDVQAPRTVSGGQITLDTYASIAHVGLGFTSDLETLNPEAALNNGTMQGRKVRVAQTMIRFINSRGGFVGPSSDSIYEIVQRAGAPLGQAIPLQNYDFKTSVSPRYDTNGRVFYRQTDPLPVTILAMVPILTVGEM